MGIVAIVRDSDGQVMATMFKPIICNHSFMIMEARVLSLRAHLESSFIVILIILIWNYGLRMTILNV